jgi:hypothetical protein
MRANRTLNWPSVRPAGVIVVAGLERSDNGQESIAWRAVTRRAALRWTALR